MSLSICVAQLNPVVGDLQGNIEKAIRAAAQAHADGHTLVVFSELFVSGYAAEDWYLRPNFLRDCEAALQMLVAASGQWPGLHIVIGHPVALDASASLPRDSDYLPPAWNAVSLIEDGVLRHTYRKQAIPNYGVFDEKRYFASSTALPAAAGPAGGRATGPASVVEVAGARIGLLICEDAWVPAPAQQARAAGAELLLVVNASPFVLGKRERRIQVLQQRVQETGLPMIYAHAVGGQDELVFDGHSFALAGDGALAGMAAGFAEQLWPVAVRRGSQGLVLQAELAHQQSDEEQIWRALVLATRDYVGKNGFRHVLLGLSGGLDSALVLAIAVDALGAERVRAVMMPSPYTASISLDDAREMARRLQVQYDEIGIRPAFEALKGSLQPLFGERPEDTTEENLQARIRGVLLMGLSNKFGGLLLTTGNKSEMAMGYCTLYGDMCGGFAPLKDVYKSDAFALAHWRNAHALDGAVPDPIPERIITRPPSAELREGQTDQDSLPPYEMLDAILRLRMEAEQSAEAIVAAGFPAERVEQVLRLLRINEYKRCQAAPGPKLGSRSFGKDWRYPITNRYRG
ncbi:NAD+ synthase [Corticibacter populi]|uniref:Glutamine-dependent NAD(+) synthetase n=1 Tax=Corticibacter populi TaxID=1550736 RepID=A0A3M6R095_9BURK|nr:NAD+ synthase [Corticibacter populi]RMX08674.1 NAD+ synthase [Corticibacter populi]RZS36014.1 NAD+ synthase (glutamine-hydrolysing) [Corticibacter populi]